MWLQKMKYGMNRVQVREDIQFQIFTKVIGSNVIIGGDDDSGSGGKEKPFPRLKFGAKPSTAIKNTS